MSQGFYIVDPREGASIAGPFPWTPSPLGMDKSVIVRNLKSLGTYNGGRSGGLAPICPNKMGFSAGGEIASRSFCSEKPP